MVDNSHVEFPHIMWRPSVPLPFAMCAVAHGLAIFEDAALQVRDDISYLMSAARCHHRLSPLPSHV